MTNENEDPTEPASNQDQGLGHDQDSEATMTAPEEGRPDGLTAPKDDDAGSGSGDTAETPAPTEPPD